MEFKALLLVFLMVGCVHIPSAAFGKRSTRNLGYYTSPLSGSSPDVVQSPPTYTTPTPSIGSSPDVQSPPSSSSYSPPSSGSSPSGSDSYPDLSPPYSSTTPSSGSSSPAGTSPVSSPVIGSPITSPTPATSTSSRSGRGSCDYWKSHGAKWPSILSALGSLAKIFGGRAHSVFGSRMSLMEALLSTKQDEYSTLARQGTTSLLNAYTVENFALTPEDVRRQFNDALASPDLARQQALKFEQANLQIGV